MDLDNLKEKEIEEIAKKMPFKEGLGFYIKVLKYYSDTKNSNQLLTCYSFLDYINDNFDEFKSLIEEDNNIKVGLKELFEISSGLDNDNLISIIIDEADNHDLIKFLNEKIDFKRYYLNDNIMSLLIAADTFIYNNLEDKEKKYIYSVLYNVEYTREEQFKIYRDNLKEYPIDFIKKLFSFSEIICENATKDVNIMMFDFTEKVIEDKEKLYNYLCNISNIYNSKFTEQELYNTFLIGMKYKEIHEVLLNKEITDNEVYEKLRILSSLPVLKGITSINDLSKITTNDLYKLEMDEAKATNKEIDSVYARNDYLYKIFENNREVIKITNDEIKVANLEEDDDYAYRAIYSLYSHIDGLRYLYPEYSYMESVGEIITMANSINHDIIILTEGDSMSIWLPSIDNISLSKIDRLKEKLDEIRDLREVNVTVGTYCDRSYLGIPFVDQNILTDYLKNNKKVK